MKKIIKNYPCLTYGIVMTLFTIVWGLTFLGRDYLLGYATLELMEWDPMKFLAFPISVWPIRLPAYILEHYFGIVSTMSVFIIDLPFGLVCCYLVDVLARRNHLLQFSVRVIIKILISGFAFPTICLWILATLHDGVAIFGPRIKATGNEWVITFSVIYLLCVIFSTLYFIRRSVQKLIFAGTCDEISRAGKVGKERGGDVESNRRFDDNGRKCGVKTPTARGRGEMVENQTPTARGGG